MPTLKTGTLTHMATKLAPLTSRDASNNRHLLSAGALFSEERAVFLIVVVTLLVYANSLGGEFLFDDTKQIVGNPQLRSWTNILHAFTKDVWDFQRGTATSDIPPPYYRPLFTIYLTAGYQLFGQWTAGWHLMNLAVHTGATLTVYYLLRRLLNGDWRVAALAAALFGIHPVHVESVSWISGIPDPLAALFYIPSFLWYVRYRENGDRRWLAASVVFYGLAALCKETALVLPALIAVWEFSGQPKQEAGQFRRLATRFIPYSLVAGAYVLLRLAVLGKLSWKHPMMAHIPDTDIWMTVPYVLMSYIQHVIWPFNLSLIYGTTFVRYATDWRLVAPATVLSGLIIALWVYRRRVAAQVWVGLALFVLPLVPVLNLKVFHQEYLIQDRYLYLPSIGFCYLIALMMGRVAQRRIALASCLTLAVLLAFGASTMRQNRVWHDSVALWQRAVEYAPHYWSTHYNLGQALLRRQQFEPARRELLEALRRKSDEATIYNNLALAQAGLRDIDGAVGSLQQAIKLNPRLMEAHNNLGTILFDRQNYAAARHAFAEALAQDPSSHSARFNLGRTLAATGDHKAAIREYETLLGKGVEDSEARYQLALSYVAAGQRVHAVTQLEGALRTEHDPERVIEIRRSLQEIQQLR